MQTHTIYIETDVEDEFSTDLYKRLQEEARYVPGEPRGYHCLVEGSSEFRATLEATYITMILIISLCA